MRSWPNKKGLISARPTLFPKRCARLGNGVILAGQVGVANRAVIGDRAIASSKSGIHGEVEPGEVVSGYPAIPNRLWLRCSAAFSKLPEMAKQIRELKKAAQ